MVYATKDTFAVKENFANWNAYHAVNIDAPTLENLEEMLEEASEIINQNIGSYNVDISDVRFLSYIQKLCLRMIKRMRQIDIGQGLPQRIPLFSPNDFLIDRERRYLQNVVGVTLGFKTIGAVQG